MCPGPCKLGVPHVSTRRAGGGESAQLASQLPRPLQQEGHPSTRTRVVLAHGGTGGCEETEGEHWTPGMAGCWEQAVCSGAGKPKIIPWRHEGSPGGGVWRVVLVAGSSSSASHIHGAPKESCGCCWWHVVCRNQAAGKGGSPVQGGGFLCTVPVPQLRGGGLRSGSKGELGGGCCPGSIRRVCNSLLLKAGLGYCSPFPSQRGCHCIQTTAVVSSWPPGEQRAFQTLEAGLAVKAPGRGTHHLEEEDGHPEEGGDGSGLCS